MLVSLNFVDRFVNIPKIKEDIFLNGKSFLRFNFEVEKIAAILTKQGFEVESIKILGDGLDNVVIGRIEQVERHPKANKLQICQVNVGENTFRQIVCGAPNAKLGLYVAVALPGANLSGGLSISAAKVRDIESLGMLCSRSELGLPVNLNIDGDGIWELHLDAQGGKTEEYLQKNLGIPIFDALEIRDVLLDISVTPNRPDMLCHLGVAREISAGYQYMNKPLSFKKYEFSNSEIKIKENAIDHFSLNLNSSKFIADNYLDAPTFFIAIENVYVQNSPAWLRNLLESIGQSSINTVVDASNYILLAYGQPNHTFDYDQLSIDDHKIKKITLRHAKSKERFLGLDRKERELHEADCVVCDSSGVQALLGVLGSDHSKIVNESHHLVVEFANPNPVSIRRTSRRYGRQTDASFMFEKGIDASIRFFAAAEFFALLNDISIKNCNYVGAIHSRNLECIPVIRTEFKENIIKFSNKEQKKILGSEIINFDKQINILSSLGFTISKGDHEYVHIGVPSWRSHDISSTADLVEEIIRIVGIDSIPSTPLLSHLSSPQDDEHFQFIEKLCQKMLKCGYHEVISLHFMRSDDYEKLNHASINSLGEAVALLNPIIGDEPLMHTTLIPDLLRKVARNIGYGDKNGQLFHSCRTFTNRSNTNIRVFQENGRTQNLENKLSEDIKTSFDYSSLSAYAYSRELDQSKRPIESPRLAGICFGKKHEKMWYNNSETLWTLHDIMTHTSEIFRSAGITNIYSMRISSNLDTESFHPYASSLHPGRCVGFYFLNDNNEKLFIGWCGEIHPKVLRNYEIDTPCFAFELNVSSLLMLSKKEKHIYKKVLSSGRFPNVNRDFSFLLQETTQASELLNTVSAIFSRPSSETALVKLQDIRIFDIYRGKGVEIGKKSVAFTISLSPLERTLTEKEISLLSDSVINVVISKLNGELRDGA